MAFTKKINNKAKAVINTGFGTSSNSYGGRFINKNGLPNIERKGLNFFERISWYHSMLQLSNLKFLVVIFCFYILVNLVFALLYMAIGIEHLAGMNANTVTEKFIEAYFFSAQTFTTVGYGRINPVGFVTSALAAVEALIGVLSFAIATGLFYGRFSKPRAFLRFSENALLAPYKDGLAIMFRVAPFKNNNLTDAEAKVSVALMVEENEKLTNKFFTMDLEFTRINSLTLSWTVVHHINEESPFYKFTLDDYKNTTGEILVFIKAFDDLFSNTVVARTSYTLSEIVPGAKFNPIYYRNEEQDKTILDIARLNSFDAVDIKHHFVETELLGKG